MIIQYVIVSVEREDDMSPCYFCSWHSFSQYFSTLERARLFNTVKEADKYASTELFTLKSAYEIRAVNVSVCLSTMVETRSLRYA